MSARTPFQHMGMQYIRRVSRDAQHACEAPTGIVVQPGPELVGGELGFELGDPVREALHFNPYPLMLAFGLRKGGFRVCASFDKSLVDVAQMERVLAQLEAACVQLTEDLDGTVGQVSCLPTEELDQIWRWNQTAPLSPEEATGRLRAHGNIKPGSEYPRAAVPWVCDPRNPSQLSPIGCQGELWLESAVLGDEAVDTPAWLVAGSSEVVGRAGKVQPTGDIVQLRPDGSLIFVGRKDDIMPVSGHAVNVADLEAHCARFLPKSARAAAAVFQPVVDGNDQAQDQELVILVEQQAHQEKSVELMFMRHDISCDETDPDSFRATVYSEIPVNLAVALKKLDKFIRDDLPSSLKPSTYVVVDRLPLKNGHVDRGVLNEFASRIASHVLGQLRDGYNKVWENLGQANLSVSEDILRSAWAKLLCMRPEQIDIDDNFFRLGGDSVLAMKLVSGLRAQGHGLSVADVFQHMRLGDAARVLKVNSASTGKTLPYKPFSTLGIQSVDQFLADVVRPKLASPGWSIKDAAPVTDSQALDIRGTLQVPRTSVQYTMLHFDQDVDQDRLFRACKDLVKTHDILRTMFIEHKSSFFQIVVNELETPLVTQRADEDVDKIVNKVCTEDIESDFALGSSFFKLFHVEGKNDQHCLVIRLSHALYDGMSLPRLLEDLETMYSSGKVGDFEPFPSYIARTSDRSMQTKALSYWRGLLQDSSLSILEGQTTQPSDRGVFKEDLAIEGFQPPAEITTANLLTAAWALLLARRTGTADVTFGGVTSGRGLDMAGVENVVGPCYQLTPIRVPFKATWTAADLMQFVQRQSGESAAHDFVGFEKISRECTRWSDGGAAQVFFDSIVHHQDWDDADSMPFAGSTARLDILNPHGDAPRPLKAVSFVKGGNLRVGVVGSERDAALVGSVLAELVAVVQELASSGSGRLLLGTDAL
jgi:aryl carrier-like protein